LKESATSLTFKAGLVTGHQETIAGQALAEECAKRHHVVIALTGAHAYGFPSPDSDLDLKGIHVTPTSELVGLRIPDAHADRVEVIEGVEIDYTSNEIGPVLAGILRGNGSYLERTFGSLTLVSSPELDSLRPLARRALNRRVFGHYHGFAMGQLKALDEPGKATAKKALYVLRTTLTGAHLLTTGEMITDVTQLMDAHGFADARELIEMKQTAERVPLGEERLAKWKARLARAFEALINARERSLLPEESANAAEVEAWLLELRRKMF